MAYQPSIADIPNSSGYKPTIADIPTDGGNIKSLPLRIGADVLAGLGEAGQGLHNSPYYLSKLFSNKLASYMPEPTHIDMSKLFGMNNPNFGDKLLQGAAEFAPLGTMNLATRAGLAGATAYGATQSGDDPLIGAALGASGVGALKGANAARPSNMFRGTLSPQELQKNLEITRGTNTPLGDVINSPALKKTMETILPNVWGSGADVKLQQAGQQVLDRGQGIMDSLSGGVAPANVNSKLADSLLTAFRSAKSTKNNMYDKADQIAQDSGLKLDLGGFSKEAAKYKDSLESTNLLKYEPETKSLIAKLSNYTKPVEQKQMAGKIVDSSGKPLVDEASSQSPTLKEAGILTGQLRTLANKASVSLDQGDRYAASVFKTLASKLGQDIDNSISSHSNEKLSQAWQSAKDYYKNNFSNFLEKEVYKFVGNPNKSDSDLLTNTFIKSGRNTDRANLINKLMKVLPDEQKNLPGYSWLSKAIDKDGKLDPLKMRTAIDSLGKNQFKALFPDPSLRGQLLNYSKLVGKNTESLSTMVNPKTGVRATHLFPTAQLLAGYSGGGLPGSLAAVGIPALAGRGLSNILTSEKVRESLVKKMIENARKK